MQLISSTREAIVFALTPDEIAHIHGALDRIDEFDSAMVDGVTPARVAEIKRALSTVTTMDHALLRDLAKVLYEHGRADESDDTQDFVTRFDGIMEATLTPADAARLDRHYE